MQDELNELKEENAKLKTALLQAGHTIQYLQVSPHNEWSKTVMILGTLWGVLFFIIKLRASA